MFLSCGTRARGDLEERVDQRKRYFYRYVRYVINIIPAIMILTRRAKRLAVPVIICTILPLAIHFAWRFLTSRWWISAAGLLEALSFLSRDRNFDYFPDDRSTSKKSVFSPVDDKSQLPSTRLFATLFTRRRLRWRVILSGYAKTSDERGLRKKSWESQGLSTFTTTFRLYANTDPSAKT